MSDLKRVLVVVPGLYLFFLMCLPLLQLFYAATSGSGRAFGETLLHFLSHQLYRDVLLNTILISVIVTSVTAAIGIPAAWLIALASGSKKRILMSILVAAMWLSILVRTYAWTILLQQSGLLSQFLYHLGVLKEQESFLFTRIAVVIGMVHVLLPYMVFVIWASIAHKASEFRRIAYSLGAAPAFYLWKVLLPHTRRGAIAGFGLVFLLSLGFYITPELLGGGDGRTMMMGVLIEEQVNTFGNWAGGASLALLLLTVVITLLAIVWYAIASSGTWSLGEDMDG